MIKEREIEYEDRKMGSPKKAADLIRPFLDGADRDAGELLGIALKDHIILGDDEKYYSFLENKEHGRIGMSINDIYEKMQETELIQKGRIEYEKEIKVTAEEILTDRGMNGEDIRDRLFGAAMEAEKAGFAAGFRCGIYLLLDCFS